MSPPASDPASAEESTEAGERKLRYELIRHRLRQAIVDRRIVPGLVLLEGPVADVFGTSRVPVRKAFHLLHEEGLLQKFMGRGYMVAPRGQQVEPLRLPIDEASLGQDAQDATIYIPPRASASTASSSSRSRPPSCSATSASTKRRPCSISA